MYTSSNFSEDLSTDKRIKPEVTEATQKGSSVPWWIIITVAVCISLIIIILVIYCARRRYDADSVSSVSCGMIPPMFMST